MGTQTIWTWSAPGTSYVLAVSPSHVVMYGGTWPYDRTVATSKSYLDWKWHHLWVTYSSWVSTAYVDGVLLWSASSVTLNTWSEGIYFWRWNDANRFYNGSLDDVAVWNRALSSSEISQLYNAWLTTHTKNTIKDPSKHFDVVKYTWGWSTNTITGLNFQPDLVWYKNREATNSWHGLADSVRWAGNQICSNATDAEVYNTEYLKSFNSDGFTLWGHGQPNTNWQQYVSWNWKAGWSTVTNTEWTITSQVSANPDAGFSIIGYTGNDVIWATIWHWLSKEPDLILVKNRTWIDNWAVYHSSIWAQSYLKLNSTDASIVSFTTWNDTEPTSKVFSTYKDHRNNRLGMNYIGYAFHSVPWYSKVWSYTGNWSVDGPFVYTGFKPRYVMMKRSDSTGDWVIFDNKRSGYNWDSDQLSADLSDPEYDWASYWWMIDLLSNWFKLKTTSGNKNTSWWNYIYIAFAEAPFKYATAR